MANPSTTTESAFLHALPFAAAVFDSASLALIDANASFAAVFQLTENCLSEALLTDFVDEPNERLAQLSICPAAPGNNESVPAVAKSTFADSLLRNRNSLYLSL